MTPSASAISLPTFVFGPRNAEGRDFQVLAQSDGIEHLPVEAQGLIYDIPLLLSAWGSSGERAVLFAVTLGPSPAPQLLCRAALLGRSGIGVRTFGHGLLVEPGWLDDPARAASLVGLIPPPDGSLRFASAPLTVARDQLDRPPPARAALDWSGLDLAWADRIVIKPDAQGWPASVDDLMMSALASVDPPEQRSRIAGWSTSAAMEPVGRFDPRRLFNLIFADSAAATAYPKHLPFSLGVGAKSGVTRPVAYHAWQQLTAILSQHHDPALARLTLPWRREDSGLADGAAHISLLHRVARAVDGGAMMGCIGTLLNLPDSEASTRQWRRAAAAMFRSMMIEATDARAAPYFLARASAFDAAQRQALFAESWQAVTAPSLAALDQDGFANLADVGLLKALPTLEWFEAYLKAAPFWQIDKLALSHAGSTSKAVDDHVLAKLVRKLAARSTVDDIPGLLATIERLVTAGRVRAVGLALSIGLVRRLRPLLPAAQGVLNQALCSVLGPTRKMEIASSDRWRACGAALVLVNSEQRNAR